MSNIKIIKYNEFDSNKISILNTCPLNVLYNGNQLFLCGTRIVPEYKILSDNNNYNICLNITPIYEIFNSIYNKIMKLFLKYYPVSDIYNRFKPSCKESVDINYKYYISLKIPHDDVDFYDSENKKITYDICEYSHIKYLIPLFTINSIHVDNTHIYIEWTIVQCKFYLEEKDIHLDNSNCLLNDENDENDENGNENNDYNDYNDMMTLYTNKF